MANFFQLNESSSIFFLLFPATCPKISTGNKMLVRFETSSCTTYYNGAKGGTFDLLWYAVPNRHTMPDYFQLSSGKLEKRQD